MAITLPTPDDLTTFWGSEAADVDEERALVFIQLAGDLFWLATRLDTDPSDPRLAQLVKYAILDLAIYMYITRDDINAEYSPFQSERIGSYSYAKQYSKQYARMVRDIALNDPTGASLFDKIVAELLDELSYGGGLVVGGHRVFREYYVPLSYASYSFGRPMDQDPPTYGYHPTYGDADTDTGLYNG